MHPTPSLVALVVLIPNLLEKRAGQAGNRRDNVPL